MQDTKQEDKQEEGKQLHKEPTVCSTCHGSGKDPYADMTDINGATLITNDPCTDCSGSGLA